MTISTTKNNNIPSSLTTTTPQQKRTRNRKRNNTLKEVNTGGGGSSGGGGGSGRSRVVGNSVGGNGSSSGVGTGGGSRGGNSSRVRRKGSENSKKKEEKLQKTYAEIITKPVIESSNPFFIAVCAPETYKPSTNTPLSYSASSPGSVSGLVSGSGSYVGGGRPRTNVFLRSRPAARNTSNPVTSYPNRFIHHPIIQNSRQVEANTEVTVVEVEPCVSSKDLNHFPSLGGVDNVGFNNTPVSDTVSASASASKLNFKEMVLRNSGGTGAGTSSTTSEIAAAAVTASPSTSASTSVNSNIVSYRITPQKSLSSSNIFLAAFHSQGGVDDDDDNYNNDNEYIENHTGGGGGGSGGRVFASSVLIDSCDKKYDRLYK